MSASSHLSRSFVCKVSGLLSNWAVGSRRARGIEVVRSLPEVLQVLRVVRLTILGMRSSVDCSTADVPPTDLLAFHLHRDIMEQVKIIQMRTMVAVPRT